MSRKGAASVIARLLGPRATGANQFGERRHGRTNRGGGGPARRARGPASAPRNFWLESIRSAPGSWGVGGGPPGSGGGVAVGTLQFRSPRGGAGEATRAASFGETKTGVARRIDRRRRAPGALRMTATHRGLGAPYGSDTAHRGRSLARRQPRFASPSTRSRRVVKGRGSGAGLPPRARRRNAVARTRGGT